MLSVMTGRAGGELRNEGRTRWLAAPVEAASLTAGAEQRGHSPAGNGFETAARQFARKGNGRMEQSMEGELRISFYLLIYLARGYHSMFVCGQGKRRWSWREREVWRKVL